jgi:hypothetical protein
MHAGGFKPSPEAPRGIRKLFITIRFFAFSSKFFNNCRSVRLILIVIDFPLRLIIDSNADAALGLNARGHGDQHEIRRRVETGEGLNLTGNLLYQQSDSHRKIRMALYLGDEVGRQISAPDILRDEFDLKRMLIVNAGKARMQHRVALGVMRDGQAHLLDEMSCTVNGFGRPDDTDPNDWTPRDIGFTVGTVRSEPDSRIFAGLSVSKKELRLGD